MRVLHVGKYYPPAPGGMEKVVQLLCESERAAGIETAVLAANTARVTVRDEWRGVPVTRVARYAAIGSVGVCPSFPRELARARRDITVLHEPNPLALVADCIARQSGPLVVWFHSEVIRPAWKYRLLYRPFLRRVLLRASRIVVSSPRLGTAAAELADFERKVTVIPFGLDIDRFKDTPAVRARSETLRRELGERLVLFVGRLVSYKGVDVLLEAARDLDATVVIAGDGPERPRLEDAARRLAARHVRFLGEVDNETLVSLYRACDVFVLPSVTKAETFGVVQLEAMACARPVVSTNLGSGVPWVNRNGETGLVVAPGSAPELRAAIARLLEDAALRHRLGEAGLHRVQTEFTTALMARRTTAMYRDVLDEDWAVQGQDRERRSA